jgi:hypothetical protein
MDRGSLVIRKARWGINSRILGIVMRLDELEAVVLWSGNCQIKRHLINALQEINDTMIEDIKKRICTSA